MDRRFLLAMVLSTLVVVVFSTWLMPPPRRPAPARGTVDTTRGPAGGAPAGAVSAPDTSQFAAALPDTGPEPPLTTFTIETPRIRAGFSSRGGGLQSFELKGFEGVEPGRPVEFVRGKSEPSLVVDLGGRRYDLTDRAFQAERRPGAGGAEDVLFGTTLPGGTRVVRRFTIHPDSLFVEFQVEIESVPANVAEAAIEVGWSGLPHAERTLRIDRAALGAIVSIGEEIERVPAGRFKKERIRRFEGAVHWAGARNKYFFAGIVPPPGAATAAVVTGDLAADRVGAAVRVPVVTGAAASRQLFHLYLGPLDYWKLKGVGFGLERAVDLGWKIILPLTTALLGLLVLGYKIIPNYGVVIIILSALTRLIVYPLTRTSMRSMQAMQKLQPEMEKLKTKHKDDPARLNQEVMALYKKHKVNPVGGCLPMLLQMPVFIALYTVLANSVELRHANFMLWIRDLSSPDTLTRINGFEVHVLPILMAASMLWQQKLTPTDPRQAALTYVMPVMMLFFFYGFPSGLALYWTVTNLLSVLQQYILNRERRLGEGVPPDAGDQPKKRGRKPATARLSAP